MAKSQLQYRCRENPQSTWAFHSLVDPAEGRSQMDYYDLRHGSAAIFDYRLVEPESKEWLARPVVEQAGPTCYAVQK